MSRFIVAMTNQMLPYQMCFIMQQWTTKPVSSLTEDVKPIGDWAHKKSVPPILWGC